MNSAVTNFFSRDAMLKRQARIIRPRSIGQTPCPSSSLSSNTLNIIVEEDESRAPSPIPGYSTCISAGGSQTLGLKAKRRHANVSDIRIARNSVVHDENDFSEQNDTLLSAPRPAPQPPTTPSPQSSPDSFSLNFTDVSFKFPHPPLPTPSSSRYDQRSDCDSPTLSISSLSSSPCSQYGGMPLTPCTSDDEFSLPSSRPFNPRRAAVQPLVIMKHNPRPSSPFAECSISPSLLQPFKTSLEALTQPPTRLSPLSPSFESDETSEDSDAESDSEWYTREFSKIISLRSPIPPSFPLHNPSRPESMAIITDISPAKRRVSKALPPTPLDGFPSGQLDPAFPRRRSSRTKSIPKYPPPPVPEIPSHFRSLSNSSTCSKTLPHTLRRPPPRSSIPADCVFDLEEEDESSSTFSFSIYEVDLGDGPESPGSAYSQPSFEDPVDGVTFDLDYSMMLPLSLPGTPIDLEADIAQGLEQLRSSETVVEESSLSPATGFVLEQEEEPQADEQVVVFQPTQQTQVDDVFSPMSPFSFQEQEQYSNPNPYISEDKTLKSKWSTSTLGSVREEHERRGASAKLRLYFGGSPIKASKRGSGSSPGKRVPATPTSPMSLLSPRKTSRHYPSSPPAAPRTHARSGSDVLVIGYGNGVGVRRRGSVTTVSDAGSEESSSSTSSSGLRRKPIPVEMFLRSAA
ncbi:hypothetical protein B0H34DRAFT_469016 [Crassisporium funariophilum]|nr:hypothetical protein B0H34DRAFT_469016 [Crassisporium funariophilum]